MPRWPRWLDELHADLARLQQKNLLRRLVPVDRAPVAEGDAQTSARLIQRQGRTLINFASNDYLALADHPHLKQAASDAIARFGAGAGASRLVTGHLALHEQVEARFARFKHAEAALLCPTGYMANLAVLTTLARPGDLICIDKLSHASLIDAARASGAATRIYPHLNLAKLDRLLARNPHPRRFIVTDSVFSMDGDCADLPALCDLARKHDAMLIVDEAHGTGLLGETGAGLCEAQGVSERVDVVISTASKALGGLGGIITAKQVVIDTLVNHARSFIFTTAVPASQAAAIDAALDVIRDEPWRRQRVLEMAGRVGEMVGSPSACAIVPIVTGTAESALALAAHLAEQGIYAPAIRPPTVAPNASRVRLSLRADLTEDDLSRLAEAIKRWDGSGTRRDEQ